MEKYNKPTVWSFFNIHYIDQTLFAQIGSRDTGNALNETIGINFEKYGKLIWDYEDFLYPRETCWKIKEILIYHFPHLMSEEIEMQLNIWDD